MSDPLFPQLPADLSSLSDEEIHELKAQYAEIAAKVAAEDVDKDKYDAQAILDELQKAAEAVSLIDTEIDARVEQEKNYIDQRDALVAKVGVHAESEGDDAGDGEGDDAEVTAEGDVVAEAEAITEDAGELVTADGGDQGGGIKRTFRRPPPASPIHEPLPDSEPNRTRLVASAGIEGVTEGKELDRIGLAQAMISKRGRMVSTAPGSSEQVIVASLNWEYPEERKLRATDPEGNFSKIWKVTGTDAVGIDPDTGKDMLLADGGYCAPFTPLYDSPVFATAYRPVKDDLPGFNADRGGITWAPPLDIADIDDAIGIVTANEDAQGGTFARKSCQVLECDDFNEAELAALFHCVQFGNMGSRAWPERVAQFNEVVMAAWARMAERNLLTLMKADSTLVTAAAATYGYGVVSNLLAEVLVAAAAYRNRHRMRPETKLRVKFPAWVKEMLVTDLISSQFDRFSYNINGVDQLFRDNNIAVSYYIDSASGDGMEFAAQTAGALLKYPTTVAWFLYAEGTFLFLDGGSLELGIVRDSTLNANNNYQIFGESFESLAFTGVEALHVVSTVCANGQTGPAGTTITC